MADQTYPEGYAPYVAPPRATYHGPSTGIDYEWNQNNEDAYNNSVMNGYAGNSYMRGADPAEEISIRETGQPFRPQYHPSYNSSMNISPELEARLAGNKLDMQGLGRFRSEALRSGPSAWAGMANAQQEAQGQQATDQAAQQAAGQTAQAQGNLAMRGGINSGARERLAASGAAGAMNAAQNIRQQTGNNKMQIGINDEQNRINQLGQLPGMDIGAHGAGLQDIGAWGQGRQFDVGNQVGEGDKRNLFNLQNYHEQMGAWGAKKQADATQKSGK